MKLPRIKSGRSHPKGRPPENANGAKMPSRGDLMDNAASRGDAARQNQPKLLPSRPRARPILSKAPSGRVARARLVSRELRPPPVDVAIEAVTPEIPHSHLAEQCASEQVTLGEVQKMDVTSGASSSPISHVGEQSTSEHLALGDVQSMGATLGASSSSSSSVNPHVSEQSASEHLALGGVQSIGATLGASSSVNSHVSEQSASEQPVPGEVQSMGATLDASLALSAESVSMVDFLSDSSIQKYASSSISSYRLMSKRAPRVSVSVLRKLGQVVPAAPVGIPRGNDTNRQIVENMLVLIAGIRSSGVRSSCNTKLVSQLDSLESRYQAHQSRIECNDSVSLPSWYHATHQANFCRILKSRKINIGGEGGTWLSSRPLMGYGGANYGDFAFSFCSDICTKALAKEEILGDQRWAAIDENLEISVDKTVTMIVPDGVTQSQLARDFKSKTGHSLQMEPLPPMQCASEAMLERQLLITARMASADRANALHERAFTARLPLTVVPVENLVQGEVLEVAAGNHLRGQGAVDYIYWDAESAKGLKFIGLANQVVPVSISGQVKTTGRVATSALTMQLELVDGALKRKTD